MFDFHEKDYLIVNLIFGFRNQICILENIFRNKLKFQTKFKFWKTFSEFEIRIHRKTLTHPHTQP